MNTEHVLQHPSTPHIRTILTALPQGGFSTTVEETSTTGEQPSGEGETTETITVVRKSLSSTTI